MSVLTRKPRRLTITVSAHVYQRLIADSDRQGRSLSNYAAYILEASLDRLLVGWGAEEIEGARSLPVAPALRHQIWRRGDTASITAARQPGT
jgi:CopG-like RHH_1 or ribbon-helix-helix domain, RHH_5